MRLYKNIFGIVLLSILISYCGSDPEAIHYGQDECEFCRMLITDDKYGAELITDKGKIYKFDSMECMVEFSLVKNLIGDKNNRLLVTNFDSPGEFIEASNSFYVKNDQFRSPMGLNVTAFSNKETAENFMTTNGGEYLSWLDVIELVKQRSN
ncbi:MAG: nitrous oxide reductase accessory protein NosL [Ignavibacteria bacterium]|jgi:copper chaperone NosL